MFATLFALAIGTAALLPSEAHLVHRMEMSGKPNVAAPPDFGQYYSVSGTIELPYTEIKEQFTAYFDAQAKKSRIDYYHGLVQTFQRADLGASGTGYKIAYMTTQEVLNQRNCFQINGTATATQDIQPVFPDTTAMQLVESNVQVGGYLCDKWQSVSTQNSRTNTYTLYVTSESRLPVRYEMLGYDTLMGSHYDRYYVDYYGFNNQVRPDSSVFEIPSGLQCHGFPGPGRSQSRVLMNPMREYMHEDRSHVDEAFGDFKSTHSRTYVDDKEHANRRSIFARNLRYINAHNRQGKSYRVAVNKLADRSEDELKALRGFRRSSPQDSDRRSNFADHSARKDVNDMPTEYNWVILGAVTPVKDQAICGSCWSFGTTGTIEGQYFMKTGTLVSLSEQQLIDCSWGFGNNGCDGGEDFRAYGYIMANGGLSASETYGSYLGQDGKCNPNVTRIVQLSGYVNVTSNNVDALKTSVVKVGPISVGIDASHQSFAFYSHGVYYEPQCGNKEEDLDHAVLVVGYGTLDGQDYWLVKNSWSTYWGTQGYVLMSQKDNNCGVMTSPTYPLLK